MSPGLFNLFINKVVSKMDRVGKGVRMREHDGMWDANVLMYADDVVLLAETHENLKVLVDEFVKGCDDLGLRVNVGKSKVLWMRNGEGGARGVVEGDDLQIKVGREKLEIVTVFKNLWVIFGEADVSMSDEVGHRIREGVRWFEGYLR